MKWDFYYIFQWSKCFLIVLYLNLFDPYKSYVQFSFLNRFYNNKIDNWNNDSTIKQYQDDVLTERWSSGSNFLSNFIGECLFAYVIRFPLICLVTSSLCYNFLRYSKWLELSKILLLLIRTLSVIQKLKDIQKTICQNRYSLSDTPWRGNLCSKIGNEKWLKY